MYAGVVHRPYDIRYEEIQTPVPQANEVLVKVKYTGICGSDIPRVNGTACRTYPMILGHEFSGSIAAVGSDVTKYKVGDRVAGIPLVPCMECEDCSKGDYALCKHYSFVGSRRYGSFAEYVVLPECNVISIGDTDYTTAAFIEPATVALHGMRCVDYAAGKKVAIIGAGTIGTLLLQLCKIYGAEQIVVFNRSAKKLERSLEMGADHVISTLDADHIQKAMAVTGGHGFDHVFETAGNSEAMKLAFHLAANHAKICMIGTPKNEVVFSVNEWELINRKEMFVTGSWMSYSGPFPGTEWESVSAFFQSGKLVVDGSLIYKKIPLSRIDEAFKLINDNKAVDGKILIDSEL